MKTCVIVNRAGWFWTGRRWSEEFPAARQMALGKALAYAKVLGGCRVVEDYGLDSEREAGRFD